MDGAIVRIAPLSSAAIPVATGRGSAGSPHGPGNVGEESGFRRYLRSVLSRGQMRIAFVEWGFSRHALASRQVFVSRLIVHCTAR